jgi:2-keto-4-pentenoate hydratase/2-oxohepta-3-ene-1,7-dioic acid hydratase in catechol pathway
MATVSLAGRDVTVSNIFCIGRNYAAHVAELGNRPEAEPLVFLKPTSALLADGGQIELPVYSQDVHHETELVVLIGRDARHVAEADALDYVAGYGIGLDLTARDTQSELKAKGMPWTKAKAFATAACVSAFAPASAVANPQALTFSLTVNGERRQQGDTALMLFPLAQLISFLSQHYGLTAGDLIYTGTPEGVARLQSGDVLALGLDGLAQAQYTVA